MRRAGPALLIAYASFGLMVSLCVHVLSFFRPPPGGKALFFALHIGVFPLLLAIVFIARRMSGVSGFGGGRRLDFRILLARSPPLLRYMTFAFFAYAIVNFALFFAATIGKPHLPVPAAPPDNVWRGFSGHWMAFYSAGLTVAVTAWLGGFEPVGVRCPQGHAVSPVDRFCPQCGKPTLRR